MTEQGSRSSPAKRSTGFGVWERTGGRQLTLAKDGETFEGISRFIRTDISGNALNFCATMNGARMGL